MDLRVKQKIVNGQKVMGVINENLKEIIPFEFKNIYEQYNCLICEKEDGTCSLYDSEGNCLINYKDGYKNLKILGYSVGKNVKSVVATKDDQIGILKVRLVYDNGYSNPPTGSQVEVAYKFGKCDEIKELNDKTVLLIKHTKKEDRIGYWYHERINEMVEPKFLGYNYYTINCKDGVGLYRYKDGDRDSYRLSDYAEYDKLTLNVELIQYLKLKNNKKVKGLKQKFVDASKEYSPLYKWKDFLSDDYLDIVYDEERQIFYLKQEKNGLVKKGFVGVSFDWHFRGRGHWVWGYPTFRIEVNVPCEYDDIRIISENYAIVRKGNKYGLIKFSFGKSNGDWDYNNNKRTGNGRWREIVPCIYDSIVDVKGQDIFIGKINDEERIITPYLEEKTNKAVIVSNNYKKVNPHPFNKNVFVCDLENNKKEIVILNPKREYCYQEYRSNVNKIYPCDNAELIGDKDNIYYYLIKVINDNIIDIYSNDRGKIEKIKEDIKDVTFDSQSYMYTIIKNDGHIECIRYKDTILKTNELGIEPDNLSVEYLKEIEKFKVTNNNITRIYSKINRNNENNIFANRNFDCFNVVQTYYHKFAGYTEILEDGLVTKLVRIEDKNNDEKEVELLKGNFEVENIVLGGKRIIFSTIDPKDNKKKYGVIESQEGNVCIDCDYDNIRYDNYNQTFICSNGEEKVIFDIDGFINENTNTPNKNMPQYEYQLTLKRK